MNGIANPRFCIFFAEIVIKLVITNMELHKTYGLKNLISHGVGKTGECSA